MVENRLMANPAELDTGTLVEQLMKELHKASIRRVQIAKQIGAEILAREFPYTFDKDEFLAAATGELSPNDETLPELMQQLRILERAHEAQPTILTNRLGLLAIGRIALFSEERTDAPTHRFNFDNANSSQYQWSVDLALSNPSVRSSQSDLLIPLRGAQPIKFARGYSQYYDDKVHAVERDTNAKVHVGAEKITAALLDKLPPGHVNEVIRYLTEID